MYATLGHIDGEHRTLSPAAPASTGVTFRVSGSDLGASWIFGLFPGAVPQGRLAAGGILPAPVTYRLTPVPDGCYYLMAAALPCPGDPLKSLLPGVELRVGRTAGTHWRRTPTRPMGN